MKIILENTVCSNTGDGAIMLAAIKTLKAAFGAQIEVIIFDQDYETSSALYPKYKIRPSLTDRLFRFQLGGTRLKRLRTRLLNAKSRAALWCAKHRLFPLTSLLLGKTLADDIKLYQQIDLIVTTGGTYLVENYDLSSRIQQFRIDLLFNKPLIFFTQSLGPFNGAHNVHALKPIFGSSPLLLMRDEKSKTHLKAVIGENNKSPVIADSVFALAEADLIQNRHAGSQNTPIKKIAISVREWAHFKTRSNEDGMAQYKQAIASLTEKLVQEQNADITFVSTCQGLKNYPYDDSNVAQAIVDTLPENIQKHVHVNKDHHNPDEIMSILKDMDLVVATRMHVMIMALCVGTPVLPIAYEFKTTELAANLKLSHILSDIETITPQDLCHKADILLQDFEHIRDIMMEGTMEQSRAAMQAATLIENAYKARAA